MADRPRACEEEPAVPMEEGVTVEEIEQLLERMVVGEPHIPQAQKSRNIVPAGWMSVGLRAELPAQQACETQHR